MNLARLFVEKLPGLRYRRSQLFMPVLRRAFAHIGRGTVIVDPLTLAGTDRIRIGDNTIIRDGVWLAAEGEQASLTVGDNNYVGHHCHLHSIDPVSIGSGCVFADNVLVTSTDHQRGNRHGVTGTGPIVIGDGVFLGQNVVVLGGVTIGDGATVAANAVVTRDVAAGALVGGVPAKPIGGS
ncbi:acyltransferase [Propionibacteriaceae bacterium G1746]|uniref:acyltransferase n=1 Tax=Aestuariimicrobium sp. G57 TaxID=3418485 RepID=UPI003C177952